MSLLSNAQTVCCDFEYTTRRPDPELAGILNGSQGGRVVGGGGGGVSWSWVPRVGVCPLATARSTGASGAARGAAGTAGGGDTVVAVVGSGGVVLAAVVVAGGEASTLGIDSVDSGVDDGGDDGGDGGVSWAWTGAPINATQASTAAGNPNFAGTARDTSSRET